MFDRIVDHHRIIHFYEVRRNLATEYTDNRDRISPVLLEVFAAADDISDDQYAEARATVADGKEFFAEFFEDFDAVLTPSSAGEALPGLTTTGDPIFCTIWTFCGLPSLSMPLMTGAQGLPIGAQLVAGIEEDDRLCRTANWLVNYLSEER